MGFLDPSGSECRNSTQEAARCHAFLFIVYADEWMTYTDQWDGHDGQYLNAPSCTGFLPQSTIPDRPVLLQHDPLVTAGPQLLHDCRQRETETCGSCHCMNDDIVLRRSFCEEPNRFCGSCQFSGDGRVRKQWSGRTDEDGRKHKHRRYHWLRWRCERWRRCNDVRWGWGRWRRNGQGRSDRIRRCDGVRWQRQRRNGWPSWQRNRWRSNGRPSWQGNRWRGNGRQGWQRSNRWPSRQRKR